MKKSKLPILFGKTGGKPFNFILDGATEHKVIMGPTRTGMSYWPILPAVADLVRKPKR